MLLKREPQYLPSAVADLEFTPNLRLSRGGTERYFIKRSQAVFSFPTPPFISSIPANQNIYPSYAHSRPLPLQES